MMLYLLVCCLILGQARGCSPDQYQCFNGDCINGDYFCDFVPDCSDESDEILCYHECLQMGDSTGVQYRGRRNMSSSGKPCQRKIFAPFCPEVENICRNLVNFEVLWCCSNSIYDWIGVCGVPICTQYKFGICNFETDMYNWRQRRDNKLWKRQKLWINSKQETALVLDVSADIMMYPILFSARVQASLDPLCFRLSYYTYGVSVIDLYVYVAYGINEQKLMSKAIDIRNNIWHQMHLTLYENNAFGIVIRAEVSGIEAGSIAIGQISLDIGICEGLRPCTTMEYQCNDMSCINVQKFCDGIPDCSDSSDETNCYKDCLPDYDIKGEQYRGKINTTRSGRICQRWDKQEPHLHNHTTLKENPCRNPDNKSEPWCHTTDPDIRFEFCSVPRCDTDCLQYSDPTGLRYFGRMNVTKSGRQCERWENNDQRFSDQENYCRNTGFDANIFCFSTDPKIRTESCYVPYCGPNECTDGDNDCYNNITEQLPSTGGDTNVMLNNDSCSSGFLCRNSDICLKPDKICDEIYQCPYHDDEKPCIRNCPTGCVCHGLVLQCFFGDIHVLKFPKAARALKISGERFTLDILFSGVLPFLIHLDISQTSVQAINESYIFAITLECDNLQSLALKNNKIQFISRFVFARLYRLRELYLDNNPILTLEENNFHQLINLLYLSITYTLIQNVTFNVFNGLIALRRFNLAFNPIQIIEAGSLDSLSAITSLDLSNNNLTILDRYFSSKISKLATLDLSHNQIENLTSSSLGGLYYLEQLNLSNNRISVINRNTFVVLKGLLKLNLSYNKIYMMENNALAGLVSVQVLDLQGNRLQHISAKLFTGLRSVVVINLNSNGIHNIERGTFVQISSLRQIYLQHNKLLAYEDMFDGLRNLEKIYAHSFTICCAKPPSVLPHNCVVPAEIISSCEYLINVGLLSRAIWFIAVFTLCGNAFVVVYRCIAIRKRKPSPNVILILNLSISDFAMGVYLMILSVADLLLRGEYGYKDIQWRNSKLCTFSGILATVSSEASAMLLFVMTIDRLIALKFPFSRCKFSNKFSLLISVVVWVSAMILSIIPLMFNSFYSKSSICISLPLSTVSDTGTQYSVGLFIIFNLALFLGIVAGQLMIYLEVRKVEKNTKKTPTKEAVVARTLLTLAFTDALCWIPIAILGLLTENGIEISSSVYAWVVVLVLPINSALNPFLYTFSAIRSDMKRKHANSKGCPKKQNDKASKGKKDTPLTTESSNRMQEWTNLIEYTRTHTLTISDIFSIVQMITRDIATLHKHRKRHVCILPENILIKEFQTSMNGNTKKQHVVRLSTVMDTSMEERPLDEYKDIYDLGELIIFLMVSNKLIYFEG